MQVEWKHRTNTGRVVYERDRHGFTLKDARRVLASQQLPPVSSGTWGTSVLALLDCKTIVDNLFEQVDLLELSFDLDAVVAGFVDWLTRDHDRQRRRIEAYVRLIEGQLGPRSIIFRKSLGRKASATPRTSRALSGTKLGRDSASNAELTLNMQWETIGSLLHLGGSSGQS